MIVQSILGHKVAAAALAITLGGTSAAAATGSLPVIQDDQVELNEGLLEELDEIESTTDDHLEGDESDDESVDGDKDEITPPVNDAGDPYGDVACEDAKNHGEYVSSVAKDDSIEGNRGPIVSQAAKTDCGKLDKEEKDAEKAERKEAKDAEKAERKEAKEAEKAERKADSAHDDGELDETDDDDDEMSAKSDKPGNRNKKNKKNK